MLDALTGGMIKSKTPEDATELIENMSPNDLEMQNLRIRVQKKKVYWSFKLMSHLMKKLPVFTQELQNVLNIRT